MEHQRRRELTLAEKNSIVLLHRANLRGREISERLNIHIRSVYRWIRLSERRGNTENLPRAGTPRKTTPEQDQLIIDTARRQPLSNAVEMRQKTGVPLTIQTYRKRLHEAGIHHRVPATKPFLTERHKEQRMAFALQYYPKDYSFWRYVVFCDEKTFSTTDHGQLD